MRGKLKGGGKRSALAIYKSSKSQSSQKRMAQIPGYQRSFKIIRFFLIYLHESLSIISSQTREREVLVGVTHTKGIVWVLASEKYFLMA